MNHFKKGIKISNNLVPYPIKLTYTVKQHFMNIIGSIFIFMLGCFVAPIAKQEGDWIIVSIGWLLIGGGSFGLLLLSYIWLGKKPIVTIEQAGVSFFNVFKSNQQHLILWRDIERLDLHPLTRGHTNHWILTIYLKAGSSIRQPLKPMLYNGLILDEKEVFNLIELIFDRHAV